MKIKQIVDEIKRKMPDGLNEIETLRYIYIYLGKQKSFEPEYFFGNRATREKIYNLSQKNMLNRDYLAKNKKLLCTSISSMLKIIASEFGIELNCQKEKRKNGAHMHNLALLKDGRTIKLDLQMDLQYIHSGQKTAYFGAKEYGYDSISLDELERIDEKIGYKRVDNNYKDGDIEEIAKVTKAMKDLDALEYILNDRRFLAGLSKNDGYIESYQYVKDSLRTCIKGNKVDIIHCYREQGLDENGILQNQYSICIFAKDKKKNQIYLYKKKDNIFAKVSQERMLRLVKQGLKIDKKYSHSERMLSYLEENSIENR